MEEIKKGRGLALAITFNDKDKKVESKLGTKGLSKFEAIGLLVFQILKICENMKKQKN